MNFDTRKSFPQSSDTFPESNTSLTGAFALARQMDEDQIIVVQESEYTGAGKSHTAQLTFAEDHGVKVYRGDTSEERPGESIVIPESSQEVRIRDIDLDNIRRQYLEIHVKEKGFDVNWGRSKMKLYYVPN